MSNIAYSNVNHLLDKSNNTSDSLPQIKDIPNFLNPINENWGIGKYFTTTDATSYIWDKYKQRTSISYSLYSCFVTYKTLNESNYLRVLDALDSEYNPIENYNRTETTSVTDLMGEQSHRLGEFNVGVSAQHTVNVNGEQTTTNENKLSKNPYDSSAFYETEKNNENMQISARTDSATTDPVTTTTSERLNKDLSYTDTHTTNSKISGNIGTVSTQNMLQQEIQLRKQSLIQAYYDNFINQYTFYVDRDDSGYNI